MKSSSSPSSSSTSVTAAPETRLLSSSSSPPPPLPHLSLQSPELQAEFLKACRNKFRFHSDVSESSVVSSATSPSPFSPSSPLSSPFSPSPSSSPCSSSSSSPSFDRQARLSLSSPELLSELKDSRTRTLRHVPAHKGLTTIFSGRGRGGGGQVSGPARSTRPASQRASR